MAATLLRSKPCHLAHRGQVAESSCAHEGELNCRAWYAVQFTRHSLPRDSHSQTREYHGTARDTRPASRSVYRAARRGMGVYRIPLWHRRVLCGAGHGSGCECKRGRHARIYRAWPAHRVRSAPIDEEVHAASCHHNVSRCERWRCACRHAQRCRVHGNAEGVPHQRRGGRGVGCRRLAHELPRHCGHILRVSHLRPACASPKTFDGDLRLRRRICNHKLGRNMSRRTPSWPRT
mmetsp:Transcript_3007/g.7757  ORF Transcript_3007/g.7757 Transcript_3007/m.7757 type:complete len:234 (+) Transcript_3007:536-1237(+)